MLACRCGTPPRQGKQSVWTPTAKAAESNAFIWGQKPRAKALPTSFLLRKKGNKENFHAKEKRKMIQNEVMNI